jgi:hypothetical protein
VLSYLLLLLLSVYCHLQQGEDSAVLPNILLLLTFSMGEQTEGLGERVKFQDGKQKAAMMKNLNRLKGSHYNISIRHDQNREDRRVEKELWEEAKRKNQEEKDAQFVHVIRGEAWSRKVVRMRRRD